MFENPKKFLSVEETLKLSNRIDQFEAATGCELVFNFRKKLGAAPLQEARRLFFKFGLDKTEHRAAILIVISLRDRRYAVWVDEKVHRQAQDSFWIEVGSKISENLKQDKRLVALTEAIQFVQNILEKEQPEESKKLHKTLSNKPITGEEE